MTRGTLRIRLIALVAAYALALQGLFAAWAPMALAGTGFPLCSGQIADVPQIPGEPAGHGGACISFCVAIGVAAAPIPPSLSAERYAVIVSPTLPPVVQAVPGTPSGPLRARAPPAG